MSSSLQTFANEVPLSVWVPIATGTVIPYLSALVTRRPNAWTGAATAALSIVAAVLGDLLDKGWDGFDLKLSLLAAVSTWAASRGWYKGVAENSSLIAKAHKALGGTDVWDISSLPPADPTAAELAEGPVKPVPPAEPGVGGQPPEGDDSAPTSAGPVETPGRHEA